MFEGKYSKLLTIGLIIGIIVIIGIIGFFTFDYIRNSKIKSDASDAVGRFEGNVENENKENPETNTIDDVTLNIEVENIITNTDGSSSNGEKMYKGFPQIGTIQIPKINLEYPILKDASKSAIEVSVAINGGPGLNKVGNTIIIGHNYRNGTFFSNNKNLSEGDKIYITDELGKKVEYTIYNIYTTEPEDSDYMDRDTEGKREVTLVTCTDDTKSRLIICAKAD